MQGSQRDWKTRKTKMVMEKSGNMKSKIKASEIYSVIIHGILSFFLVNLTKVVLIFQFKKSHNFFKMLRIKIFRGETNQGRSWQKLLQTL